MVMLLTRMASSSILILSISILASLQVGCSAQSCQNYTFMSGRLFKSCTDLPYLNAHLHWNYNPSRRRLSIAYRATQSMQGWIAWAINPTGEGMIGSEALVAYMNLNGSMTAYTTPITSYNPSMLPAELSFPVSNVSTEYSNNQMIIYALLRNQKIGAKVNHVWQAGSSVHGIIPQMHSTSLPHLQSIGQINFRSRHT